MATVDGGDELEIGAVIPAIDLSSYYTKTDAYTLLPCTEYDLTY